MKRFGPVLIVILVLLVIIAIELAISVYHQRNCYHRVEAEPVVIEDEDHGVEVDLMIEEYLGRKVRIEEQANGRNN